MARVVPDHAHREVAAVQHEVAADRPKGPRVLKSGELVLYLDDQHGCGENGDHVGDPVHHEEAPQRVATALVLLRRAVVARRHSPSICTRLLIT